MKPKALDIEHIHLGIESICILKREDIKIKSIRKETFQKSLLGTGME